MIFVNIGTILFSRIEISLYRRNEGGLGRPPRPDEKDPSALGCGASGDLVEGRVANLIDLHLWSSVHHFRQGFQH